MPLTLKNIAARLQAHAHLTATSAPFYHGTKAKLPVGKSIVAKPSNERLGAIEGVFEWARAQLGIGVSRLKCVFLTHNPKVAENFGPNIYRMAPEGKYAEGHSSWIHVLMDVLAADGCYKLGKVKRKPKASTLPLIEKVVRWYFTGKAISAAQAKELGLPIHRYNSDSYIHEVLAPKAKILAFEYDRDA